jgi:hypothetical protein
MLLIMSSRVLAFGQVFKKKSNFAKVKLEVTLQYQNDEGLILSMS